mgnify:CR=1 FL=1
MARLRSTSLLCSALLACTSPSVSTRPPRAPLAPAVGDVGAALDAVRFEGALPTAPGRHRATLRVGGLDREVATVVPRNRAAHPALLLILHGTRGDGPGVIDECGALPDRKSVV